MTIEIVASGVADADPILKTIATATVAAGQTNEDSVKNAPINYETTAKAIAYEAWTASGSKSIDEFTPNQAALNTLAGTIQTALGASIDGTKTLNDATIQNEAKGTAETVTETPAVKTPVSIALNPTAGSIHTNGTFDLATIVVTATYSDASTKAVTGHTWSVKSGGGSLSGSTYTPPTTSGSAVLTCTFTENGATVSVDLTITIAAAAPILASISLNPGAGSVATNGTFNLATIVVTATYSDSSAESVTGHTWSVKSGGGSISGSTYTPPTTAGTAILTCTFTERSVIRTADLTLNVTAPAISVELINVPAGTFQRDANAANLSTVSAFRMSKFEVTREQFLAIMSTDPSSTANSSGVTDPVQNVNWYHALAFCNKLSIADGLTPVYTVTGVDFSTLTYAAIPTSTNADWNAATCNWSANGYRLPTEMEWMWAAMGADIGHPGSTNTTGYLKAFSGSTGSNLLDDFTWNNDNSGQKTHSVGTKLPNELGLYDMSGNVKEWCWELYGSHPDGGVVDYRGVLSGTQRVLAGGGWYQGAYYFPLVQRNYFQPDWQDIGFGFRVVRP